MPKPQKISLKDRVFLNPLQEKCTLFSKATEKKEEGDYSPQTYKFCLGLGGCLATCSIPLFFVQPIVAVFVLIIGLAFLRLGAPAYLDSEAMARVAAAEAREVPCNWNAARAQHF